MITRLQALLPISNFACFGCNVKLRPYTVAPSKSQMDEMMDAADSMSLDDKELAIAARPFTRYIRQLNSAPFVRRLSENPLNLSHFMTQRCSS